MSELINCIIHDTNMYNDTLNEQFIIEYVIKYLSVIASFIEYAYTEQNMRKEGYLNFVVQQGISTIHHIFLMLLLYTKNIELVFSNLKKAYYYYIEFIQQIKKDEHQFLKFSVKDAILFVYKKTVNELNDQYVQQHKCDEYNSRVLKAVEHITYQWNEIIYALTKSVHIKPKQNIILDCTELFQELHNKLLVLCQHQLTETIKSLKYEEVIEMYRSDDCDIYSTLKTFISVTKLITGDINKFSDEYSENE